MPYSEAVRPTRLHVPVSGRYTSYNIESYRAISPRFAMSTEVSGLIDAAVVELWCTRCEALMARSGRARFLGFRTARMIQDMPKK